MLPQSQMLIVMVIYMVFLISWGIYQGMRVKSSTDYSIGGRVLPGWAAALSERATGESAWALLGLPGAAYATGLMEIWTAIGCVFGVVFAWIVLAWRLQREAHKYDVQTFTDYLAKRHSDFGQAIRVLSSLTIVFFFFFYVGAQFVAGGKTLFTMFHIKPEYGMLITAAVIIPYTIFGGFRSVVYTDVIQAIVMVTTLVLGPIVGMIYIKNHPDVYAHSITAALSSAGPSYTAFIKGANGFQWGLIISGLSWMFGYFGGMPQLTTRFMSIRDHRNAKIGRNVGVAWTIVAYIGALALGWIGLAIFGPDGLSDREFVMPKVLMQIFPPYLAALLITGAIAAMISTADSLLILSSTELAENILSRRDTDRKKKLAIARIATAVLAVIALGVAFLSQKSDVISRFVYDLVSYVWAGIGGTFSVIILLSLFWRRFNGLATVFTIIIGIGFTIVWISTGMEEKIMTARVMTFVVALLTAVIVTLLSSDRDK